MIHSPLDIAAALFAAIEAGRADDVDALYADDIVVWHNFSKRTQNKAENLQTLRALIASAAAIRYDVIERMLIEDTRVLQRHDLQVRTRGGKEVVIPACIFVTVRDGHIVRIDEYLDTAQAAELRNAG